VHSVDEHVGIAMTSLSLDGEPQRSNAVTCPRHIEHRDCACGRDRARRSKQFFRRARRLDGSPHMNRGVAHHFDGELQLVSACGDRIDRNAAPGDARIGSQPHRQARVNGSAVRTVRPPTISEPKWRSQRRHHSVRR
jgi:hypothetical protein